MLSKVSEFATKTFLLWMFIAAIIGFIFPTQLATMGQFVPWLLGIVMLGMGMTIKPSDFKLVFKEPRSVIIGVILHSLLCLPWPILLLKYLIYQLS